MDTDSFFQIVDRHCIARLKEYHYGVLKNPEAQALAKEQADDLAMAGEVLLWEYATGKRVPRLSRSLRVHDHAKVEGRFGPHSAEFPEPKTVMECAGMLAQTHADYWQRQGRVQTLKKMIRDGVGTEVAHFESEFVKEQRAIDLCNELRNRLIQAGDLLLVETLKAGGHAR